MNFLVKYCCIVSVTIYFGLVGLIGGVMICGYLAEQMLSATSGVPGGILLDVVTWGGGTLIGGLPSGFIAANWIGAKFGWNKREVRHQQ